MMNTSELHDQAREDRLRNDRQLLIILLLHFPVVAFLVPINYGTTMFALLATVLVCVIALAAYWLLRGTRYCSVVFSLCLMLFSAIMIQAQLGRIEMHFHIFAALALLTIYRDWLPVVIAAGFIALHHLFLTALQLSGASLGAMPLMVYNYGCSWGIAFMHAAFVVFEAAILILFALRMGAEREQSYRMIALIHAFSNDKDLSERLSGEAVTVRTFNDMLDQFSGLISRLRDLSTLLLSNANHLNQVSSKTGEIVSFQQAQMEQAAAATHQMSTSIQDVSGNAHRASQAAIEATEGVEQGSQRMVEAVSLTRNTKQVLEQALLAVKELESKVGAITTLSDQINDISEQTNLLALNAAIEAARAGESGRGFSVVADEVRSLSRRTYEFTNEIRQTTGELKTVSDSAIDAIERGQSHASETNDAVAETRRVIEVVQQAIHAVSDMNTQIAAASEQQAATSSEINRNIHQVVDRNGDIVAETGKLNAMARELDASIEQLEQAVGHYRTE